MKIYNSRTNKLEELNEKKISIYVCGPTLYSDIHIGNARPIIFFDVVHRYFKSNDYQVTFASNITDIDDKIIKRAHELKITEEKLVSTNTKEFKKILKRLNILKYDYQPNVTNYIDKIIKYISKLIKKDYAYENNGNVYFRVNKVKNYGELSNIEKDFLKSGTRIDIDSSKEYIHDFVLWKKTDVGISFDAPFGKGRPGWHTECACMIDEIFPDTLTIHGGGVDLKFPHHENEIAQQCAFDKKLADFWMHNGFINSNNEKMSKSIGNTLLTKDLLNRYDSNIVRLLMYQTNYRQPINIDDNFITQTIKINEKFKKVELDEEEIFKSSLIDKVNEYFENDFNIPNVLSFMVLNCKDKNKEKNNLLKYCFKILGLVYENQKEIIPKEVLLLIEERKHAKVEKNFALADKIKVDILNLGYEVTDTRNGVICKKK